MTITVELLATDVQRPKDKKALQAIIGGQKFWVPYSQIESITSTEDLTQKKLRVSKWWADQNNLADTGCARMIHVITAEEYKSIIASLGCVVELCGEQACLHHPRMFVGIAQRSPDWTAIPLCKNHHQDGGPGTALHADQTLFEQNHGTEAELLSKTIEMAMSAALAWGR